MEIDKKIKILNTITMTNSERSGIRNALISYMNTEQAPALSPYAQKSPYAIFTLMRGSKALALALILMIVIGSGSTLSFAASRALPGESLWWVKNINEQVTVSLAATPAKKAEAQKTRIKTRLEEVSTLKASGKLNSDNSKIVKEAFVSQAQDLNTTIDSLQASGDKAAVLAVTQDLIPTLVSFKNESGADATSTATLSTTATLPPTNEPIPLSLPLVDTSASDATASTADATATSFSPFADITPKNDGVASADFDTAIEHEVEHIKKQQAETLLQIRVVDGKDPIKDISKAPDEITPEDTTTSSEPVPDVTALPITDPAVMDDLETILPNDATFNAAVSFDSKTISGLEKSPLISSPSTAQDAPTLVTSDSALTGMVFLDTPCILSLKTCPPVKDTSVTRSLLVYDETKSEIIAQIKVESDGSFFAFLPQGNYVIDLVKVGLDTTKDLPTSIMIPNSGSVSLTITINPGH